MDTELTDRTPSNYNQIDATRDPNYTSYANGSIGNNDYNPYVKPQNFYQQGYQQNAPYQGNYGVDANYNTNMQASLPSNLLRDLTAQGMLYRKARSGFIMKVYLVLFVQLAITVGMCALSCFVNSFFQFQIFNWWIFWVTLPIMIIVQIFIFCCPSGRKSPINIVLLLIFTVCEAYSVSYITAYVIHTSGTITVLVAAGITLSIVVGLTLYAMFIRFTARDYLMMAGIIIVCLFAMIMMGIISIFTWNSIGLTNLWCAFGVIIFGIYLVWDTKMIVGGQRFQLSLDDYVVGALLLYIDIIQIFLYILLMMRR